MGGKWGRKYKHIIKLTEINTYVRIRYLEVEN